MKLLRLPSKRVVGSRQRPPEPNRELNLLSSDAFFGLITVDRFQEKTLFKNGGIFILLP